MWLKNLTFISYPVNVYQTCPRKYNEACIINTLLNLIDRKAHEMSTYEHTYILKTASRNMKCKSYTLSRCTESLTILFHTNVHVAPQGITKEKNTLKIKQHIIG